MKKKGADFNLSQQQQLNAHNQYQNFKGNLQQQQIKHNQQQTSQSQSVKINNSQQQQLYQQQLQSNNLLLNQYILTTNHQKNIAAHNRYQAPQHNGYNQYLNHIQESKEEDLIINIFQPNKTQFFQPNSSQTLRQTQVQKKDSQNVKGDTKLTYSDQKDKQRESGYHNMQYQSVPNQQNNYTPQSSTFKGQSDDTLNSNSMHIPNSIQSQAKMSNLNKIANDAAKLKMQSFQYSAVPNGSIISNNGLTAQSIAFQNNQQKKPNGALSNHLIEPEAHINKQRNYKHFKTSANSPVTSAQQIKMGANQNQKAQQNNYVGQTHISVSPTNHQKQSFNPKNQEGAIIANQNGVIAIQTKKLENNSPTHNSFKYNSNDQKAQNNYLSAKNTIILQGQSNKSKLINQLHQNQQTMLVRVGQQQSQIKEEIDSKMRYLPTQDCGNETFPEQTQSFSHKNSSIGQAVFKNAPQQLQNRTGEAQQTQLKSQKAALLAAAQSLQAYSGNQTGKQ